MAPERRPGGLGDDVPERDVDEAERPHDEPGTADRDRRARALLPEPLRIGLAADDDGCDELLDARRHGSASIQAVRLPDEASSVSTSTAAYSRSWITIGPSRSGAGSGRVAVPARDRSNGRQGLRLTLTP